MWIKWVFQIQIISFQRHGLKNYSFGVQNTCLWAASLFHICFVLCLQLLKSELVIPVSLKCSHEWDDTQHPHQNVSVQTFKIGLAVPIM